MVLASDGVLSSLVKIIQYIDCTSTSKPAQQLGFSLFSVVIIIKSYRACPTWCMYLKWNYLRLWRSISLLRSRTLLSIKLLVPFITNTHYQLLLLLTKRRRERESSSRPDDFYHHHNNTIITSYHHNNSSTSSSVIWRFEVIKNK